MRKLRKGESYGLLQSVIPSQFLDPSFRQDDRDKSHRAIKNIHIRVIGLILFFISYVLFSDAQAQSGRTLGGVVRSAADGQTIEGVSVQVGKKYTLSDKEGTFSITVADAKGVLKINHIGFKEQSVAYDETTTLLDIQLHPAEQKIEEVEVVSTGYQTIPKERATGSFVQIGNELLNRRVAPNILDKLDGVAPGLQFDNRSGRPLINIRGINTLRDVAMGPLIIVDNFPFDGDIETINPNDVESVTLLKDAAAASIWGARAANGVLVINLKKASAHKRMSASFTSNLSIVQKPDLFYYRKMSSSDFIDVETMLFEKGHYNTQLNGANAKFFVFSPVVDALHRQALGQLTAEQAQDEIDGHRSFDYRNDMMEHVYRNGLRQQHALNLNGTADRFSYLFSAGYDNNKNPLRGSGSDRLNLRLVNTFRPIDKLEVKANIAYTTMLTESGGGSLYPINPGGGKTNLYPYARLVDEQGLALPIPRGYNFNYAQTIGDGQLLDWLYRPVDDMNNEHRSNRTNHLAMGLNMRYEIMDHLNIDVLYSFERQNGDGQTLYGEESFYTRDLINRFTQISNGTVKRIVPLGDILTSSDAALNSHRVRAQANYSRPLFNDGNLTLFLGSEVSSKTTASHSFITYGYNGNVLTAREVDFVNPYPIFDGLATNSRIPNAQQFNGAVSRFASVYANGSYEYKKRYIASFSARRDASNSFGVKTNSRWNPLWSSGLSWIVSNEDFLKGAQWINSLKIRGTYGHSGNSGGGNIKPLIIYNSSADSHTNLPYAWLLDVPNPFLKWEDVRMINYGLDFSVFNNRVGGSLEYFTKKSTDLIADDPIDPTTGFAETRRNVAEINSKGFDLQVNSANIRGKFNWNSSVSLSYVKDIVSSFYGSLSATSFYVSNAGKSLTPLKDKSFYSVFSYRFEGLDPLTGDPQGFLKDEISKNYNGILTDSLQNIIYHGSGLPPFYGFFRNSFSWKNIDFSFSIAYKFGAFFRKETIGYAQLFNSWVSHADYENRWQQPGDEAWTDVPSMVYPAIANRDMFFRLSEPNVLRSDLIRLQDVRVGYTFSSKTQSRPYRVQVYATGSNLGLLWTANGKGLDPDYNNLPPTSTFSMGIKADF